MTEDEFRKAALAILRNDVDAWVRAGPLGYTLFIGHSKGDVRIHVVPRRIVLPGPPNGTYNQVMWTVDADGLGYAYRILGPHVALDVLRRGAPKEAEKLRSTMYPVT